ncbi:collagen-like triple helix repeat-containing protein [Lentilactobacillus kefiri]|uniref:collagen-like triple helix repeat-containing protein n=1 Tax=Lentilactobacillus kefiri TaxID=33962 RepID=UPI001CDADD2D|nr:collagen-like protein [Lentilactobacillus kefiri]
MSKELAFTDDNDVVKYLDTTTAFNLALTADGVAFDLTNAKSILVKIANDDGYIMQQTIDLTTVTSPLGGTLSFPINQDIMNTLVPDDYDIEVWVTMNDGTQAIFPSDGTLGFSIEENLMSDTGEVIPTITLNDFQQQFNDLSNQMENAVHNVQKGDKGDTGTGLEIKDKVSSVSNLPSTANEGDGYLVGEELYVWVNGAWKDCGPLQGPKGIQGIQGNTGTGISSTTIQYQISSSATTAPTGAWSNNIVATTTINPYLWMKATLNYTDHTTKVFYLVSPKGDKGDTGPTGPIGPIGPRGPVGSGLVVKGTVKDASQLPTAGNQEGYCYFIGTDLYVWNAGAWKNCGSVSPDLSNYVTVTDLNNGLSTKVNVSDMRKPASDVAGIEEVNTKQDKIGYTPADDSQVAHLSGANNFDTVPTVKNNPLLLASSLPSDLARTGSNQEFTGKNTFDIAPIDKTTGNPYITKDGVPAVSSTLADTTKDANFTGKLQKSGIDVATTTDIKNAVNTAVSPSNINTNWVSLSVDSSQIKDTDWDSIVTNCNYRIAHSTLYLTGKYRMLATSNNQSRILFQLPTNIVSQISFTSTNEFQIGVIQAFAQTPIMFMISLTNDGKISAATSPYDISSNYHARAGLGFINAAIPLN